jgi:hypothetical protein
VYVADRNRDTGLLEPSDQRHSLLGYWASSTGAVVTGVMLSSSLPCTRLAKCVANVPIFDRNREAGGSKRVTGAGLPRGLTKPLCRIELPLSSVSLSTKMPGLFGLPATTATRCSYLDAATLVAEPIPAMRQVALSRVASARAGTGRCRAGRHHCHRDEPVVWMMVPKRPGLNVLVRM